MQDQDAILASRIELRFFNNIIDPINLQTGNGLSLDDRGQIRIKLSEELGDILKVANAQIENKQSLFDFVTKFANKLYQLNEFNLSRQCLEFAEIQCDHLTPKINFVKAKVFCINFLANCAKKELLPRKYIQTSPKLISRLLNVIEDLRKSLELIFDLSIKEQEEIHFLALNSAKLIYETANPMIWWNCGKYVTDSLIFAAISMEAIINLCTMRHMKFRLKLYSCAIYSALVQGTTEEANSILEHSKRQVNELKEREELDQPLAQTKIDQLNSFTDDIFVMTELLKFWKDADSFSLNNINKINPNLTEKCLLECCRVQQLTSTNLNENWKKRSSVLLKAAFEYLSTSSNLFSLQAHLDIIVISIFDGSISGVQVPDNFVSVLFQRIESKLATSSSSSLVNSETEENETESTLKEIKILKNLAWLIGMYTPETENSQGQSPEISPEQSETKIRSKLDISFELLNDLENFIHSTMAEKRRSILRRISLSVWVKYIYPTLQSLLKNNCFESTDSLIELVPSLMVAYRSLLSSSIEDPILVGSVGISCVLILREVSMSRDAISIAKRTLDLLEDHRASRVDVLSHLPEDDRDTSAVQRASFSVAREASDWFHSVKRLGAHAFAGFGIFGTCSSADMTDIALAEIQTDLTCLYFRLEIEYAIEQKVMRRFVKTSNKETEARLLRTGKSLTAGPLTAKPVTRAETLSKFNLTRGGGGETVRMVMTGGGAESTTRTSTTGEQHSSIIQVDKLQCVSSLKSYCCKNSYAKCLLSLEIARAETNPDMKIEHLKTAIDFIEEAEAREERLKSSFSFSNLSIASESDQVYPIVLARTSQFIIVAPVARPNARNVVYYRVLGREEGSGTAVSITNDDLGGSETRIYAKNMHSNNNNSPSDYAVRISALRPGERYVFASAGIAANGKPVGEISRTSPAVEAVNPLPTVYLWYLTSQTAFSCGVDGLGRISAQRVVQRYLYTPSRPSTRCVGSGLNLFFTDQPILSPLVVKQASSLGLYCFVQSFLKTEQPSYPIEPGSGELHWDMKKSNQTRSLYSLRRIAMVSLVAAQLTSHELVVQSVSLGYEILSELLEVDEQELANYLQKSIIMLTLALQSIEKRHWTELEHMLYCRLVYYGATCALRISSSSNQSILMDDFFKESGGEILQLNDALKKEYYIATSTFYLQKGIFLNDKIKQQISSILGISDAAVPTTSPTEFWEQLSQESRLQLYRGSAETLLENSNVSPRASQLKTMLKELPHYFSDYLNVLFSLCRELLKNHSNEKIILLFQQYPIYKELFTPEAQRLLEECSVDFILPYSHRAAAAAAAAPPPAKGKAPPAAAQVPVEPVADEVPGRFSQCTPEENDKQICGLAGLIICYANANYREVSSKNLFPVSSPGPFLPIDPEEMTAELNNDPGVVGVTAEDTPSVETTTNDKVFDEIDYIRYFLSAMVFYSVGNAPITAIDLSIQIFNYVTRKWISPKEFAFRFKSLQQLIVRSFINLVDVYESIADLEEEYLDVGDREFPVQPITKKRLYPTPPRTLKQGLYSGKEFLVYMLKVIWILDEHKEVVQQGLKIMKIYLNRLPDLMKDLGNHSYPLILYSQSKILSDANASTSHKESAMTAFIQAWKDEQARKNKKKLRIARVEKTDEELRFEAELSVYEGIFTQAKGVVQQEEQQLEAVVAARKRFDSIYSTGAQLLDKVRANANEFLKKCKEIKIAGEYAKYSELLDDPEISFNLDSLIDQYDQVSNVLRLKKDRVTLIETLKSQGELLLVFGQIKRAQLVWLDAVDGLFNTLDTWKNWESIIEEAIKRMEYFTIAGALPVIAVLGSLSKYSCNGDWDRKTIYCRMISRLCKVPFMSSLSCPLQDHGFAAYCCRDLGGVAPLSYNAEKLSLPELCSSLHESIKVLETESLYIEALPLVVLLEHIYANYMRKSNLWLSVRIVRIRLLISLRFFSEAVAMLTDIKLSILSIENGVYDNLLSQLSVYERGSSPTLFDVQDNGLNFYGCPPFYNNQPPDSDANKLSVDWVFNFPEEIKPFLNGFSEALPEAAQDPLSQEELDALEAAAKITAAEAEAAAAKSKAKPPAKGQAAVVPDPVVQQTLKAPLFSVKIITELSHTCAYFLSEISGLECKITSVDYPFYHSIGKKADTILLNCFNMLTELYNTKAKVSSSDLFAVREYEWISLYGLSSLTRASLYMQRREYREARGIVVLLLRRLYGTKLPALLKVEYSRLWLACRLILCDISHRQGRFEEGIFLASKGIEDAKAINFGYYVRKFLFIRCQIFHKLGNYTNALLDINDCIINYEEKNLKDVDLLNCHQLKLSIVIDSNPAPYTRDNDDIPLEKLIDFARESLQMAQSLAESSGLMGSDMNISYESNMSSLMKNQVLPPVEYGLTNWHENDCQATLKPKINPKKAQEILGPGMALSKSSPSKKLLQLEPNDIEKKKVVRRADIDQENIYSPSVFANIYLKETQALVLSHSTVCTLLQQFRLFNPAQELLEQHIRFGEEGLKLLRYTFKANPVIRIQLLISVGKTRREMKLKSLLSLTSTLSSQNMNEHQQQPQSSSSNQQVVLVDGFPIPIFPIDPFLEPFTTAISYGYRAGPHWKVIRNSCLELVETYGNSNLLTDIDNKTKLKSALIYLMMAIKLTKQFKTIFDYCVTLSADKSFAVPIAEPFLQLMSSSFTTSMMTKESPVADPVVDPKAKGKPAAAGISPAGPVPTAKDVLFLLRSILSEYNSFLPNGFEHDLSSDIHFNLKKSFTAYDSECTMQSEKIDLAANVSVQYNSISTLLVPCVSPSPIIETSSSKTQSNKAKSDEMVLSHLTCYFILGGEPPKGTGSAAAAAPGKGPQSAPPPTPTSTQIDDPLSEPILTKIIFSRKDALNYENKFLEAKAVLADSVIRKSDEIKKKSADLFCEVIKEILNDLLQTVDGKPQKVSVQSSGNELQIVFNFNDTKDDLKLTLTESILLNFSEVFSVSKECIQQVTDIEICQFLKYLLGFRV